MAISDFYDSTVVVQQKTVTRTGMGGSSETFSSRISSLPCRIDTKRVREQDDFGKVTVRTVYRLYCEASTTNLAMIESDRVIFGSLTFEITGIANPGQQDHHLEVDLVEVN
jgi:hypothetical protein